MKKEKGSGKSKRTGTKPRRKEVRKKKATHGTREHWGSGKLKKTTLSRPPLESLGKKPLGKRRENGLGPGRQKEEELKP